MLAREDVWAYTPEHRRLPERAHQDSREGRDCELTERELADLQPVFPSPMSPDLDENTL